MEKQDSFERLATGISDEERRRILDQMQTSSGTSSQLHSVEDNYNDSEEPFEIKIKTESIFVRFLVWVRALISNTTQRAIYNEIKINEISHKVEKNFPGIISAKNGRLLDPFYEGLTELKDCAAFFKPYFTLLSDDSSLFYVYLSSIVMPAVTSDIQANVDPYSNPVKAEIRPDLRISLIRKLDEIFETIPSDEKAKMYQAAKASEWMKEFLHLPFNRFISLFSDNGDKGKTSPFGQVFTEIELFSRVLCNNIDISDELLEALFMFAFRNSKHASDEETGRDAGEFLNKAHSNLSLLQMFMNSIPIRSISCLVHNDYQWKPEAFSGGEDWFVKYKNAWKKIFEQKWQAWEADCKRALLLQSLKTNFNLDSFPKFPERPWAELWGGIDFAYESTISFLYWFMTEKFSEFELDLKTLLVQGSFNKIENHSELSDAYNAMIQLSISFNSFSRQLSVHGEYGGMFNKIQEDKSRTLQAQNKVEQMMRSIESESKSLIHRFGDAVRPIINILNGALGYSKDQRYDTVKNINIMKDKNNKPFSFKIEKAKTSMENALNFVIELEGLDKQKSHN
ncbi:MAG: DUF5312 domain-containing protein [Treponema sp.]|nr:DUF5312 domain-containing protein [Treponema sp.]